MNFSYQDLLFIIYCVFTYSLLIDETNMCLTEWANVIACLLKMSATNLEIPLEHENVSLLISKIVTVLKKNINVDILEESMIIYIQSFPHHLNFISGGNFHNSKLEEKYFSKLIINNILLYFKFNLIV